jgi:hypothetical protein
MKFARLATVLAGIGFLPLLASSSASAAVAPGYANPLRACHAQAGRIDQGVDYTCDGPVYALATSTIIRSTTSSSWPGGGDIVGKITSGPLTGHLWYIAEDVRPSVGVGVHVTDGTVIGHVGAAPGPFIEVGWASTASSANSGPSLASQRGDADPHVGAGEWSTGEGVDYANMLHFLGAQLGGPPTNTHGVNPWNSVTLLSTVTFSATAFGLQVVGNHRTVSVDWAAIAFKVDHYIVECSPSCGVTRPPGTVHRINGLVIVRSGTVTIFIFALIAGHSPAEGIARV